ncbi:MAG TPA: M67 family metallopeptidase [Bacteroidales bacterium]|jgi:proteasome lid subunit RPN8/RPN11|nr:M67 family metallopeptidase [Bacteroidales bacterium]
MDTESRLQEVIRISSGVVNAIISHARQDLPNEACGYLAGKNGFITKCYPMTNVDASAEHFAFDPAQQFYMVKSARQEGLEILGNYHSHPETPARPSHEDIRLAYDPDIIYLIISLADDQPELNAFRISNGEVNKIEILTDG